MSLIQYLHTVIPSCVYNQFNNWQILLSQCQHIIVMYRLFDQLSNWDVLLPRYLQTFVSIAVSADVTLKLSRDIYKTRGLQKNRKGLLELNWTIHKWMSEKAHLEFDKYNAFLNEFGINLLRISKQCIRLKLINVLSRDQKIANMELTKIIDTKVIQLLMNDIYLLTHVPMHLTDVEGNLLVNVGWQDICTKFHRVHPETYKDFIDQIKPSSELLLGEFKLYKCENNMLNVVTPINIYCHVGYLHFGHFSFEDEPLDYEYFRSHARKYGFNEQDYIDLVEKVPRVSREDIYKGIDSLVMLAKLLNHKSNRAFPVSWLKFRLKIYFVKLQLFSKLTYIRKTKT